MQLLSDIPSSSGKLGGTVASRGRAGFQLVARVPRTQPRSDRQTANRAIIGALASLWRTLDSASLRDWNQLAASSVLAGSRGLNSNPSGYTLFLSCARNLTTLGLPPITNPPPLLPSLPAVDGFAVSPVYNQPGLPHYITGFAISYLLGPGGTVIAVVRASGAVSPGRSNIRPSEYRVLLTYQPFPPVQEIVITPWFNQFGTLPPNGQIAWALNFVDPASGFASPWVKASMPYQATPTPAPTPGTITLEQNGTPIATLSNITIEIGGAPIAGS
jgi:hypothetical protein